jgi:UDP-glucuronate decarboxylase
MRKFYLNEDIDFIINNSLKELQFFDQKHIILTGGNGFLGKYFTITIDKYNNLFKKNIKLTIIDNCITSKNNFFTNFKSKNIRFIKSDAAEKLKIRGNIDYIIHAAGIASPFYYRAKPLETLDIAVNGLRNILNTAKSKKSKVLFFSSSEIYGDPDVSQIPIKEEYRGYVNTMGPRACYDEGKRLGETLCYIYNQKFGIHTNIVRPFNIYGPGMSKKDYRVLPNFASLIKNNKPINIYGSGKQTRTFCYISDALVGFLKIMKKGKSGEAYNIGNPKPEISMINLHKVSEKILNKKIKMKQIKYPKTYPGDEPQRRCPNIDKAKFQLGYFPKISLEEGLSKFYQWAAKNYN